VTQLCLATGARWSEAETLRAENLSRELVTYVDTKSGRNRSVPITPALFAELNPKKKKSGRLFKPCYNTFRTAIDKTGITLPDGQMTHVLRHTFASHFMMNGGNILVLQKILGHTTLTMTMRYAHLAPDHLKEAARLNPLAMMNLQGTPDGVD
jgi:integrase